MDRRRESLEPHSVAFLDRMCCLFLDFFNFHYFCHSLVTSIGRSCPTPASPHNRDSIFVNEFYVVSSGANYRSLCGALTRLDIRFATSILAMLSSGRSLAFVLRCNKRHLQHKFNAHSAEP